MTQRLAFVLVAGCVALLLAGCSDTPPSAAACPPTFKYPDAFKTELADEAHQLGEGSATARALEDYALLRQEVEACNHK